MSESLKYNKLTLWNDTNLPAPNGDFCSYDVKDFETIGHISDLVSVLSNAASQIGSGHPVWYETKLFLALQEMMALKLPCDKFLHILKRVGRCLQNLASMKLFDWYLGLAERFLQGMQIASEIIYLPSKQQLEYLLIRTQGAAKLILKTISYTEETFVYLIQRLKIGHLVATLLMTCATIGRIRTSYMALLLQICEIYKQVKHWQSFLKEGTWQWPQDPNLPEDLWKWLKPDLFEKQSTKSFGRCKDFVPFLNSFFTSNLNETITDCNENIFSNVKKEEEDMVVHHISNIDVGEVQPRNVLSEFENIPVPPEKSINKCNTPSDENINEDFPLLNVVKETKSVKELLFILKLLCSRKQKMLKNIFDKISENSCAKIKKLFWKLKSDFKISKDKNDKKMRKKVLRKSKAKLCIVFQQEKQKSDLEVVSTYKRLTPVRTLAKLQKLFNFIKSEVVLKPNELHLLINIFKQGRQIVKLLRKSGNNRLAKKHIFSTSKKLIRLCKKS